ncbi:MAG: hypothetical protein BKP49_01495 [Treponema sp. CETP13]|nr:MAG: hypothetical protein BKP49_01495 [Treponema sp. CETP13]
MTDELKNAFIQQHSDSVFIKKTDRPLTSLSSSQKALLNRKGNEYFNEGKFTEAQKLFITTGYSDGLIRCGDRYLKNGNDLDALKLYWLAHNKHKIESVIQKIAHILSIWTEEE